jgi:hypothetical protein
VLCDALGIRSTRFTKQNSGSETLGAAVCACRRSARFPDRVGANARRPLRLRMSYCTEICRIADPDVA